MSFRSEVVARIVRVIRDDFEAVTIGDFVPGGRWSDEYPASVVLNPDGAKIRYAALAASSEGDIRLGFGAYPNEDGEAVGYRPELNITYGGGVAVWGHHDTPTDSIGLFFNQYPDDQGAGGGQGQTEVRYNDIRTSKVAAGANGKLELYPTKIPLSLPMTAANKALTPKNSWTVRAGTVAQVAPLGSDHATIQAQLIAPAAGAGSGSIIATVPAWARPARFAQVAMTGAFSSNTLTACAEIAPNGDVYMRDGGATANGILKLHGVYPLT